MSDLFINAVGAAPVLSEPSANLACLAEFYLGGGSGKVVPATECRARKEALNGASDGKETRRRRRIPSGQRTETGLEQLEPGCGGGGGHVRLEWAAEVFRIAQKGDCSDNGTRYGVSDARFAYASYASYAL